MLSYAFRAMQEEQVRASAADQEKRLRRIEEDAAASERRAAIIRSDAETQANRIVSLSVLADKALLEQASLEVRPAYQALCGIFLSAHPGLDLADFGCWRGETLHALEAVFWLL